MLRTTSNPNIFLTKRENPFAKNFITEDYETLKMFKTSKKNFHIKPQKPPLWLNNPNSDNYDVLREIRQERRRIFEDKSAQQSSTFNMKRAISQTINNLPRSSVKTLNFINQKREMFLIQLKIDEKKEKIKYFDSTTKERGSKLTKYETLIKSNLDQFTQFVDSDKVETNEQIREAENLMKEKLQILAKLKELGEKKTTKMNHNVKMLERVCTLISFKQFLDSLTPAQFLEKESNKPSSEEKENGQFHGRKPNEPGCLPSQKSFENERKNTAFGFEKNGKNAQSLNYNNQSSNKADNNNSSLPQAAINKDVKRSSFNSQNIQNMSIPRIVSTKRNVNAHQQSGTKRNPGLDRSDSSHYANDTNTTNTLRKETEKMLEYLTKANDKLSPEVVDFICSEASPQKMYFDNPSDLINIYNHIEEKNLKLMKETQKLKMKHEEQETFLENLRKCYEKEQASLVKQGAEFEQGIIKFKAVTRNWNSGVGAENEKVQTLLTQISQQVSMLAETLHVKSSTNNPVELLLGIETKLSTDINRVKKMEKTVYKKLEKAVLDEKKLVHFKEVTAQEKRLAEERKAKLTNKLYQKVIRRADNFRSWISNQNISENKDDKSMNGEEDDETNIYFN